MRLVTDDVKEHAAKRGAIGRAFFRGEPSQDAVAAGDHQFIRKFVLVLAMQRTAAPAIDLMHPLAYVSAPCTRVCGAKEFIMYIGAGAILVIILIFLFLR